MPAFEPLAWALIGAIIYPTFWIYASVLFWFGSRLRRSDGPPWTGRTWRAVLVSAPVAGAVGGALIYGVTATAHGLEGLLEFEYRTGSWHLLHVNVWMPPALVATFLSVLLVHAGLVSRALPESIRQWVGRLGAWLVVYALGWLTLFGIAMYGPALITLADYRALAALVTGWLGTTGLGLLLGRHLANRQEVSSKTPGRIQRWIVAAAPRMFLLGIVGVAVLLYVVLSPPASGSYGDVSADILGTGSYGFVPKWMETSPLSKFCTDFWAGHPGEPPGGERILIGEVLYCHAERTWHGTTIGRIAVLLAALLIGTIIFASRVDINTFATHPVRRNRLLRVYLGASNTSRRAQPFTDSNPQDDLALADLVPQRGYDGPLPIHDATLDLAVGREPPWQRRRRRPFVFTPIATGFEVLANQETASLAAHGYRPTEGYRQTGAGVTLGTAIAICGTGQSPAVGEVGTEAGMAFLLKIFNLRYGWWIGNPRHRRTWFQIAPRVGVFTLLAELFGFNDATFPYVFLTEGGGYDSLSVYELVRRRCSLIVASDASVDPDMSCEALGNAIRRCFTDLGIEIHIDTADLRLPDDDGESRAHCAVGSIRYDRVDHGASPGTLIYLKPGLTGDEPHDVFSFRMSSTAFPHETILDRDLDETRFESYRKLGEHVALRVFGSRTR